MEFRCPRCVSRLFVFQIALAIGCCTGCCLGAGQRAGQDAVLSASEGAVAGDGQGAAWCAPGAQVA